MKAKARNGIRYLPTIRKRARFLREQGWTHREISKELKISLGSADLWTRGITLSTLQKKAIQLRRRQHEWTTEEKIVAGKRLVTYKKIYTDNELIEKIRSFYNEHGRIPLKREFNSLRAFRVRFGSWNAAIRRAGFDPNPHLFAYKFLARDGHRCDSFTEKIIDDWLLERGIAHDRHVPYRGTKMTADFALGPAVRLEFFGLAGVQKKYDELLKKKRLICKAQNLSLIEAYPRDLFPINKLEKLLVENI